MFTGIVEAIGAVHSLHQSGPDRRLTIAAGKLDLGDVRAGDSIAVNGCCLTAVSVTDPEFTADVSPETLRCTTLGELQPGAAVNLEKAMLATDRFGGHLVNGHIDGVAVLHSIVPEGASQRLEFAAPAELSRYLAAKGSVSIDGTSLTVNRVDGSVFTVQVIPHTRQQTIIGSYTCGQRVNLEVDVVARYLERLSEAPSVKPGTGKESWWQRWRRSVLQGLPTDPGADGNGVRVHGLMGPAALRSLPTGLPAARWAGQWR